MRFKGGRHLKMGCLYALLMFDLLAWTTLTVAGWNLTQHDPYRTLHAPYYFHLPVEVALAILAAMIFLRLGKRLTNLRCVAEPIGAIAAILGLLALPAYLFVYTGGV
jgi:hypothetical protein